MKLVIFIYLLTLSTITHALPFQEYMKFDIHFGLFKGGEITYVAKDTIVDGERFIHSNLRAYTTGLTDRIYAVNDRFESHINPNTALPFYSSKDLSEQQYHFKNSVEFHQESGQANSYKSGWKTIQEGTCDASALIHHLRHSNKLQEIKENKTIQIPFWDNDKWFYLNLRLTAIETIKTKHGTLECLRIEPEHVPGKFFNKKNPMSIWISNDPSLLPVQMELNFSIGSVQCKLDEASF